MTMRIASLALLSGALLAGCGSRTADMQNDQGIVMANEFHEALMKLSPGRQRLTMLRALRDNRYGREHCIDVTNAGYQEDYQNMRMWVAECGAEQRSYAVFLAPNGDVQVRNCADMGPEKQLPLPSCKALPPAVADPTMPKIEKGAADKAFGD